jgi:hypothetical protein
MAAGSRLTLTKFTSDWEPPVPSDTRATIFIQQDVVGETRIKAAIASKNEFSGAGDITYLADVDMVNNINEEIQTVKDDIGSFSLSMGANPLWGYHGQALFEKGITFPVTGALISDEGALSFGPIVQVLAELLRFESQNLTFPNTYNLDDLSSTANIFVCATATDDGAREINFQGEFLKFPFYILNVQDAGSFGPLTVRYTSATGINTTTVLDSGKSTYLAVKHSFPGAAADAGPNNTSDVNLTLIRISDSWFTLT